MRRRRNVAKKSTAGVSGPAASSRSAQRKPAEHGQPRSLIGKLRHVRSERPVVSFFALFVLCMVAFYVCEATPLFQEVFFPAYFRLNASVTAAIVDSFGGDVLADGPLVVSPQFRMEVRRGCDAVEPSALFISAVLASPVSWAARALGAAVGTALLMLINVVRLVSLYYIGVYFPGAFQVVHVDVWQAAFILITVLLWAVWVRWAKQGGGVVHDAEA